MTDDKDTTNFNEDFEPGFSGADEPRGFKRPSFERGPRPSEDSRPPRFRERSFERDSRPRFSRDEQGPSRGFSRDREFGRRDREFGGRDRREGGSMMPIDGDLLEYFPNPGAVNQALRALAGIIRNQRPPRRSEHSERSGFGRSERGRREGFKKRDDFTPRAPFKRHRRDREF